MAHSYNSLSANQEKFCVEYAATGNSASAYKNAFGAMSDEKAQQFAVDLLSDTAIRQRVLTIKAPAVGILTKTDVLEELSQIVRTALFPADRIRALDLLGKYYKLFADKDNPQKVYVGENKIQIIYMSPDHKRITSVSPLRDYPEPLAVAAAPADTLEADLADLCG